MERKSSSLGIALIAGLLFLLAGGMWVLWRLLKGKALSANANTAAFPTPGVLAGSSIVNGPSYRTLGDLTEAELIEKYGSRDRAPWPGWAPDADADSGGVWINGLYLLVVPNKLSAFGKGTYGASSVGSPQRGPIISNYELGRVNQYTQEKAQVLARYVASGGRRLSNGSVQEEYLFKYWLEGLTYQDITYDYLYGDWKETYSAKGLRYHILNAWDNYAFSRGMY